MTKAKDVHNQTVIITVMLSCSAGYYIPKNTQLIYTFVHSVDKGKDIKVTHLLFLYTSEV